MTIAKKFRVSKTFSTRSIRGISMTETLYVMPVLVFFVLAIVQLGLIYRTKITLEYAAHEAARAGSLNNGQPLPFVLRGGNSNVPGLSTVGSAALEATSNALTRGSVWQGMVNAMMPLFVTDTSPSGLIKGWAKTNKELIRSSCIEYVNPTQQTFIDWGFIENFGENRWILQIPNDTMRYRKPLEYEAADKKLAEFNADPLSLSHPADSGLRGRISRKSLGEANVLHLRLHYGYELKIPVVNKVIFKFYKEFLMDGLNDLEKKFIEDGKLPLKAEGSVGMQSPLHWHIFYSFGPSSDRTPTITWNNDWNEGTGSALERPGDTITGVFSFIRDNLIGNVVSSGLGAAVDSIGNKVGSGFAFCPAAWGEGMWKALEDKVPNSANPGVQP